MTKESQLTWESIDNAMPTFTPSSGGYSLAKRGFVTLGSGERVFIKLATEEGSRRFIPKEIAAYEWLAKKGYPHIPKLLLTKADGFVLPDLSAFDWSDHWDVQKLTAVFAAIDDLGKIELTDEDRLNLRPIELENGWQLLKENPNYQEQLFKKITAYPTLITAIKGNIDAFAASTEDLFTAPEGQVLLHADIRADNLAYDKSKNKVYLVDWNWMGLGNRGLEDIGLLVNVAKSGLPVETTCPEKINKRASLALAGFWFYHSTIRIWKGGNPKLRELQLNSALKTSEWAGLI